MPGHTWRQTFESEEIPRLAQLAADRLAAFADRAGLPPNIVYAADFSLSEYLREAVDRGCPSTISLEFNAHIDLTICVSDDGTGFDPTEVPAADFAIPDDCRPADEMGIAIMRRLVDLVEYTRCKGVNQLRIVKRLGGLKLKPAEAENSPPEPVVSRKIRVSVVEDDTDFQLLLCELLEKQADFEVVESFGNVESCVASLEEMPVDVILMDIQLPRISGLEGIRQVLDRSPKTLVVMLTTAAQLEPVIESMRAGAVGYIVKGAPANEIVAAVRDAFAGGSPMSGRIARMVVHSFLRKPDRPSAALPAPSETTGTADLSLREKELLDLLAQGASYKIAAEKMNVSLNTVRCYVRRVYQKLGAKSRMEAVRNRPAS